MKKILAILAAAFIGCSCQAQDSVSNLVHLVASSVASNSVPDPAVDAALDKMLSEDKVSSSLIVAKLEWLLNRPDKAISILEDLVQKHGEESDGQRYIMPVGITANYWIGTIARQKGDAQRAKKAYEDVLACAARHPQDNAIGHEAEKQFCYQYISEIQAVMLKQTNAAIETLMKIPQRPPRFEPGSEKALQFMLFSPGEELNWDADQAWIDYQIAILKGKQDEARASLKGSELKLQYMIGTLAACANRSGIKISPWIRGRGEDNRILQIQGLRLAIKSNSPIDRSFALLALGSELQSDQPVEAEKYYTELLESDSFYAPVGGIYLAALQRSLGKADEADKTDAIVKKRFPGYAMYFIQSALIINVDKPPDSPPEPLRFNL